MDLGTIIVIVLALLFFGGIGYLSWSARKTGDSQDKEETSAVPSVSSHPREAGRRKRRAG